MTKILALLFLITTGLYAQTNNQCVKTSDFSSLVVTGQLSWVIVTNWSKAGASSTLLYWNGEGENPNVTTWHENGTTISNLYFGFQVQGQHHAVLLRSEPFGPTLQRSYVLKTDKVYK